MPLANVTEPVQQLTNLKALQEFARLIMRRWYDVFRARWWYDIVEAWSTPTDEESLEQDGITVHNKTLKKIKVCLYASDDCLCWIPLGGVSGSMVGFIPAEHSRVFTPKHCDKVSSCTLKVFQPGLLDVELACHLDVQ